MYGEKMPILIDILTDPIPGEEVSSASDHIMQLKEKLMDARCLVRETLKTPAGRQKKQHDCRVTEFKYKRGDLVLINQKRHTWCKM